MNLRGLKQASRQCLRDSRSNPWKLSALYALCYFGSILLGDGIVYLLSRRMDQASGLSAMAAQGQLEFAIFVINVVLILATVLWSAGYAWFALRLSRGQEVSFHAFLQGFRLFSRVILLYLLQGFFIWCWSLLFVIPGIVAAYRYRMAVYALLDNPNLSTLEAIQSSKCLTYGHKAELFRMDLSFLWYYLPVSLATYLPTVLQLEYLPWTVGIQGLLMGYAVSILVPLAMTAAALPFVNATEAHAYNWLVSLDRARREDAWGGGQNSPNPW